MECNYMIDGDDGSNCQSSKHDESNCPYCSAELVPVEEEMIKVCPNCKDTFWGKESDSLCPNCE